MNRERVLTMGETKKSRRVPSMTEVACWIMISIGVGSLIATVVLDMMGVINHG